MKGLVVALILLGIICLVSLGVLYLIDLAAKWAIKGLWK
jgi:hypothetical protein